MKIGEKVKKLRKEQHLTQKELADLCNVSFSFISDIETGRRNASIETLTSISKALNVPLSSLLQDDVDMENLPQLSAKNERDIKKDLERTLNSLENECDGLMFDGEPLDNETKELLKISLENSMRLAKQIAKQKFTPKKYR